MTTDQVKPTSSSYGARYLVGESKIPKRQQKTNQKIPKKSPIITVSRNVIERTIRGAVKEPAQTQRPGPGEDEGQRTFQATQVLSLLRGWNVGLAERREVGKVLGPEGLA